MTWKGAKTTPSDTPLSTPDAYAAGADSCPPLRDRKKRLRGGGGTGQNYHASAPSAPSDTIKRYTASNSERQPPLQLISEC